MVRVIIIYVIVVSFFSCSQRSAHDLVTDTLAIDSIAKPQPLPIIYKDTLLDNTARYFAGMPQLDSNKIAALENDEYWLDFKKSMDTNWEKMQAQRLKPMEDWQTKTLSPQSRQNNFQQSN